MTTKLGTRSLCPKDLSSKCDKSAIKIAGSGTTRSELLSRRPLLRRLRLKKLRLARGDLLHDAVLTRPRRTLQRSRKLQSQLRLRGDVRVVASLRNSLRSREKSLLLLSKLLQASLAAGVSNSATETDPRLMIGNAPRHRSRRSLQARVASITTAIVVAQNNRLMSRIAAMLHLPNPRTATTAGGSSRQLTMTTWVVRCLAATTTVGIEG